MKIALFSGPTAYSVCLANALSECCKVSFFYGAQRVKETDETILDILNHEVQKCPINSYRIRDVRNLWGYYKIARELNDYDIIHIQSGDIWLCLWRHLFRSVPIVCTVHDPYQHVGLRSTNSKYQDIAQRWAISQSAKFIVLAQKLKEDLAERYDLSMGSIEVIPHGELSFYKRFKSKTKVRRKREKNFKRILFFGAVRKNKGLEYLIKAEPFISAKADSYKICIAGKFEGDFDYYRGLMRNTDTFEIIDKYIPNNEVADLIESSDMVVLPYIGATQSGVLALAFGFGKPVIASDTGSIGEVIEHGKTGLLVPPRDEKLLAAAILELLLDEEKCLRLGGNADEVAKKRLNWDSVANQTVQLYKSVI